MKLSHAQISFKQSGTPVADEFGDVYFFDAHGADETDYVFIEQNHIITRWLQSAQSDQTAVFTIAETGFGTGLNFFQTVHHYLQLLAQGHALPRLYFLSTEKFPLHIDDLHQAISVYPHLIPLLADFSAQYPMALTGCHRIIAAAGAITLDLWLGDINDTLPQWHNPPAGLVDAWYLDGFAPSKNPDMWQPELFTQLARLSKPNATLATFTASSLVRRGLKDVGFTVSKCKGFKFKREMVTAVLSDPQYGQRAQQRLALPYYQRHANSKVKRVSILGGGIAAACTAYLLTQQGIQVDLYCHDEQLAMGASGNDLGGFYPQLNAQAGTASQIHAGSFLYARRFYDQIAAQGAKFAHDWCGVMLVGFNDKVQARQANLTAQDIWPDALIEAVTPSQASDIANLELPYPGLFVAQGGWISPPELVQALCQLATDSQLCTLHLKQTLTPEQISTRNQSPDHAIVYTTGAQSALLDALPPLPYRLVRGQVERLAPTDSTQQLNTVLCHKGYFTPAYQGWHAMGSTYVKEDSNTGYRSAEAQLNLHMHQASLPLCPWMQSITLPTQGRAATRCSTPDHLPLVGALPDVQQQQLDYAHLYKALPAHLYPPACDIPQSYILTGLGSRGLTTAPLMAQLLVSQLLQRPLPVSQTIADALNPNRFLIRDGIRKLDYLARFTTS